MPLLSSWSNGLIAPICLLLFAVTREQSLFEAMDRTDELVVEVRHMLCSPSLLARGGTALTIIALAG